MKKEMIKNLPVLGKRLVGLYSWYLRMKNRKFMVKNRELKKLFSGRRAFIIATGPSVKEQNLKGLAGKLSISVSNFFLHPDFKTIAPKYHLFVPSHPPVTSEQYAAVFKDAEAHFPADQNILVSVSDKGIIEKYGAFKNQNIYYYTVKDTNLKVSEEIDFTKPIPRIQTSAQIGLFLAIFLGAQELYLLGCDHDWILHLGETRHFYDEKQSTLSKDGYNEWKDRDFGDECESYSRLWTVYRQIRAYARARGVAIYNSTEGGLLDVFPRKKLEDVLASPKS